MAVSINGSGTITGVGNIESVPAADVDFTPSGGLAATNLQSQVEFINKMVGTDGYAVPIAYASGISLTLTSQTVDYNGVIYAPRSSALPFTTSSWGSDSAKFRAVQVTDADLITYTPAGTGAVATTVQSKLRELFVSPKEHGAIGNWNGVTGADDTIALQKAFDESKYIDLGYGNYKISAPLVATTDHVIIGRGFGLSIITATHSTAAITVPAPASDVYAGLNFDSFTIRAKYGVAIGGNENSHATDGAIIGPRINVQVIGTYGASSGDSAYDTDNVCDSSGAMVSSASETSMNALKTWYNLFGYGVGISLSKCIDTKIDAPQFYGNGVAVAIIGCDLTRWEGGRAHEVGIFMYDQRVGTWGSQNVMIDVNMLHNRRAGGVILNNTKYSGIRGGYYECYSNSALLTYAEGTEGSNISEVRVDDPYYTGGGGTASATTPLALFVAPRWSNKIAGIQFQKFTLFTVATPPVRVVNSGLNCDTNHPEVIALENRNGYVPIRFTSKEIGCRYGYLIPGIYTPENVPERFGGNLTPLAVVDAGDKNVFYWATASFPTVRFNLTQVRSTKTLVVNAKAASGTTIFFSAIQKSFDGTSKATVFNSTIDGFNVSAYSTQSQALALTDVADGDYLDITWQSNTAYVAGIELA